MGKSGPERGAIEFLRGISGPMLASSVESLPKGEWILEPKYDGFRALAACSGDEVALVSRNGNDLSDRFADLAEALLESGLDEVVIDGEIVSTDPSGIVRFELTQYGGGRRGFALFDLLYQQGNDIRGLPLEERRARLEKLLSNAGPPLMLVPRIDLDPAAALAQTKEEGHEGLIAKRPGSVYESRRSRAWLKLKLLDHQEFVIVGFRPLDRDDTSIGSLLLAVHDGAELRYVGRVGTGFTNVMRKELFDLLRRTKQTTPPVSNPPRLKDAIWVDPGFVAEVRFTEWTHEGMLRHPAFLGIRDDKSASGVVREPAAQAGEVRFTNVERILYPRDGYTKKDLALYYTAVAAPLLRALEGRPLSLEHWNEGIDGEMWYEQGLRAGAPSWVSTIETPTRTRRGTVRHPMADSVETLQWFAQRSVLGVHMWASRKGRLEQPDWLVLDLDPTEKGGFSQAIDAAQVFRGLLETLEISSVPKTSGKKGIHIFIPLAPGQSYRAAESFARQLCRTVATEVPGITVERSLAKRKGRLYADAGQNGYGKTVVAPYSPRAADHAPVSAPLEWDEVKSGLNPADLNIRSMPERMDELGDLFEPVLSGGVVIPRVKEEELTDE